MIEQEKERFREQEKTENQRKDFAHKVSTDLVNRFDLIAFQLVPILLSSSHTLKNITMIKSY